MDKRINPWSLPGAMTSPGRGKATVRRGFFSPKSVAFFLKGSEKRQKYQTWMKDTCLFYWFLCFVLSCLLVCLVGCLLTRGTQFSFEGNPMFLCHQPTCIVSNLYVNLLHGFSHGFFGARQSVQRKTVDFQGAEALTKRISLRSTYPTQDASK